jgi:hypothetical protein
MKLKIPIEPDQTGFTFTTQSSCLIGQSLRGIAVHTLNLSVIVGLIITASGSEARSGHFRKFKLTFGQRIYKFVSILYACGDESRNHSSKVHLTFVDE